MSVERRKPTNHMNIPERSKVVGIPISMTSYDEVMASLGQPPTDAAMVVCVCNVHSVMSARRSPELNRVITQAEIATPDGVPLVWALRWTADPDQSRVYGPELMKRTLQDEAGHGYRHFLYGATADTLASLQKAIAEFAPQAEIVGSIAPPFRELAPDEHEADMDEIRASGADIVWVGLGMPKQELWMGSVKAELPGIALVGVGAAFDFLAENVKQAPEWMQRSGLEWLYRLIQEPKRLWRRYLWNNPSFVMLLSWQLFTQKVLRRPPN